MVLAHGLATDDRSSLLEIGFHPKRDVQLRLVSRWVSWWWHKHQAGSGGKVCVAVGSFVHMLCNLIKNQLQSLASRSVKIELADSSLNIKQEGDDEEMSFR